WDRRRPGDRGRAPGRAARAVPSGAAPGQRVEGIGAAARRGGMSGASRRTLAPFGRRRGRVTANRVLGAYRVLEVGDPDGPAPRPGQFYMLANAERWGGEEAERPFLPRAFSFLRAGPGRLEFLLEEVGPGTRRLGELTAGEDLWLTGPLGIGFAHP